MRTGAEVGACRRRARLSASAARTHFAPLNLRFFMRHRVRHGRVWDCSENRMRTCAEVGARRRRVHVRRSAANPPGPGAGVMP